MRTRRHGYMGKAAGRGALTGFKNVHLFTTWSGESGGFWGPLKRSPGNVTCFPPHPRETLGEPSGRASAWGGTEEAAFGR